MSLHGKCHAVRPCIHYEVYLPNSLVEFKELSKDIATKISILSLVRWIISFCVELRVFKIMITSCKLQYRHFVHMKYQLLLASYTLLGAHHFTACISCAL